ncbi:leucine-rich repeat extensin-like protein 5 [Panicum virgatum]|uniref:leucine-rich repeat extensin-like protein 5 n=1 Tax=Panicum virgatum TaxID=38727 RepID=UPI0019D5E6C0|nr:leucine-rich repeat extensin-like protein 5 [Panicum virgatum]
MTGVSSTCVRYCAAVPSTGQVEVLTGALNPATQVPNFAQVGTAAATTPRKARTEETATTTSHRRSWPAPPQPRRAPEHPGTQPTDARDPPSRSTPAAAGALQQAPLPVAGVAARPAAAPHPRPGDRPPAPYTRVPLVDRPPGPCTARPLPLPFRSTSHHRPPPLPPPPGPFVPPDPDLPLVPSITENVGSCYYG